MVWELERPAPVLTSLSPSYAVAGTGPLTLTVNGTGFQSGTAVHWDGIALTTSLVSASELQAAVPSVYLNRAGTGDVTAVNPQSAASNALSLTVVAPIVLTVLSPWSITAASRQNAVRVSGSAFTADCEAFWNGSALATTFVSGAATVRITSWQPGVALVPRLVVVPQGASPATFRINTLPTQAATVCRITGTYRTASRVGMLTVDP